METSVGKAALGAVGPLLQPGGPSEGTAAGQHWGLSRKKMKKGEGRGGKGGKEREGPEERKEEIKTCQLLCTPADRVTLAG